MNVLSRTNSRALLNWVEAKGQEVFLFTDRVLAAEASRELGFKVTESNFAGTRKELGLVKSRSDQQARTLRDSVEQLRRDLEDSMQRLHKAERRAHEQAEVVETLLSQVGDHRDELLRQAAQLCALAKKAGVTVEFADSELQAAAGLREPAQ